MENNAVILLVEDHKVMRENLRLTLFTAGYQVLTASDGFEALEILQESPVDLILADIAMPRMNGYKLYERIRANPRWVTVPFIFLTARAMDSDIRFGKALGVDDYLTKPVEPEDLLAVVQGKLRRAQQLAQSQVGSTPNGRDSAIPTMVGSLRIAPGQHRAWVKGDEIVLSAREFKLLEYLVLRVNQVVSPQELVETTHGFQTSPVDAGNLLRPLIRSLRRKLGYPVGVMGCIENVRGVGYRLVPLEE